MSKVLQAVLDSVTDPMNHPVVRVSDAYSNAKTGVANPFERNDILPGEGSNPLCSSGKIFAALFRDPMRACVISMPPAGTVADPVEYAYAVSYHVSGPADVNIVAPSTTCDFGFEDSKFPVRMAYAVAQSSYQPHTGVLWCGTDPKEGDGSPFIWMDGGCTLRLSWTDNTSDETQTFNLDQWSSASVSPSSAQVLIPDPTPEVKLLRNKLREQAKAPGKDGSVDGSKKPVLSVPGTVSVTIGASGYYRLRFDPFQNQSDQLTGLSFVLSSTGYCNAHRPIPQIQGNLNKASTCRISAASILLTNTSSELNKSGSAFILQSSPAIDWVEWCTNRKVSASANVYQSLLEKGIYGWLRPTQATDLSYRNDADITASGVIAASYFQLRPDSAYLVVQAEMASDTSISAFSGILTTAFAVEFPTDDVWVETDIPRAPVGIYEEAFAHLRNVPQFHENPLHIANLVRSIGKVVNEVVGGVERYLPMARRIGNILSE